jgi:hypothetical protein
LFLLRRARTPVERGGNFRGIGIERDLIFETLPRLIGSALPEGQPCRLPVRIGCARAIRKALLQLAEVVDGVVVVALQQIHVAGGKQRLFQPRACRSKLPQLVERPLYGLFIAGGALRLTQQIKALGFGVAGLRSHGIQNLAGIVAAAAFFERSRQRQLTSRTLGRSDLVFIIRSAVIVGRFAVVLGFEQKIGAGAALGDGAGDPELVQFRSRRISLRNCWEG